MLTGATHNDIEASNLQTTHKPYTSLSEMTENIIEFVCLHGLLKPGLCKDIRCHVLS